MSNAFIKRFCCKFTNKPFIDGTISCILVIFGSIGVCLLIWLTGGLVSYVGSLLDFNDMKIINQDIFLWFLIGLICWMCFALFSIIVVCVGMFCHMHVIPVIKLYFQNVRKEISEIAEPKEIEEVIVSEEEQTLIL